MEQGRLIFGGSFNPLHIGHMRVAIESLRWLEKRVGTLEFIPAAMPPHKSQEPILPFAMRIAMIEATIRAYPQMTCDSLEGDRKGASYTWDTLKLLGESYEPGNLYFLLGSPDFGLLPEWHRGLELNQLCNLVIVPRGAYSVDDFLADAWKFWREEAKACENLQDAEIRIFRTRNGHDVIYLPVHWLDISATLIRRLWLERGNLDYLVPAPALEILNLERQAVAACWREKKC